MSVDEAVQVLTEHVANPVLAHPLNKCAAQTILTEFNRQKRQLEYWENKEINRAMCCSKNEEILRTIRDDVPAQFEAREAALADKRMCFSSDDASEILEHALEDAMIGDKS